MTFTIATWNINSVRARLPIVERLLGRSTMPLYHAFFSGGTVLAGRDGSATGTAAVAVARSDAALSNAVTTVDDIGAESGRITTALALSDLLRGSQPGRYGIGQGATSVTVPQ